MENQEPTNPLAKDLFLTLSFHAKMHAMLDKFSPGYTEPERERVLEVAERDTMQRFEQQLSSVLEKIEKKELGEDNVSRYELELLKNEARALKEQIDEIRNSVEIDELKEKKVE